MYLEDLKIELSNYKNISRRRRNKALNSKIKYIPSHAIFNRVMYRLGVGQRHRVITRLVTDITDFNENEFAKNNTFKLSEHTVVFEDYIDERKFNMPKGKIVEVYTRKRKVRTSPTHSKSVLDVAYLMDGKLLIINKVE